MYGNAYIVFTWISLSDMLETHRSSKTRINADGDVVAKNPPHYITCWEQFMYIHDTTVQQNFAFLLGENDGSRANYELEIHC